VRWGTGAFFLLLVLFGAAPSHARAGCSHSGVWNTNRTGAESLYDLEVFKLDDMSSSDPVPLPVNRDLPCSGPSCSGKRGLPDASAPASSVRTDPCCRTIASPTPTGPESPEILASLPSARPEYVATSIERPPRLIPATTHSL
jgi:hypothetical protein